eukprot:SAG11_NODE_1385_length_5070_cov_3.950915_8_plen_181_part_00
MLPAAGAIFGDKVVGVAISVRHILAYDMSESMQRRKYLTASDRDRHKSVSLTERASPQVNHSSAARGGGAAGIAPSPSLQFRIVCSFQAICAADVASSPPSAAPSGSSVRQRAAFCSAAAWSGRLSSTPISLLHGQLAPGSRSAEAPRTTRPAPLPMSMNVALPSLAMPPYCVSSAASTT